MSAIAQKGGASRAAHLRQRREQIAEVVAVATLDDLRALLLTAAKSAVQADDRASMISAVRAAVDLLRTVELEAEVKSLREMMNGLTKGRA